MTRPPEATTKDMRAPAVGVVAVAAAAGGLWWWRGRTQSGQGESPHILDADEVQNLYDRLAGNYDLATSLYDLVGARRLRARAVDLLDLAPGDTVVDLGCGTGVNLSLLARAVGDQGHVIGVDLSAGMLQRARRRIQQAGFSQVELIQADLREVALPAGTDAVLSTYALEMVPDYDHVIQRIADTLDHGRIAVCGLRSPDTWPRWAIRLGIALNTPFGVNPTYESIRPRQAIRAHTQEIHHETAFLGAVYLSVGQT